MMRAAHRLALAVQPIEAATGRRAGDVTAGREVLGHPPVALEGDTAGFKLRHGRGVGDEVTIRLDDRHRRWVPRRFDVALWTAAEVAEADEKPPTGDYRPAAARLLRPWLLPGSGWSPPWGTTGLRGRVVHGDEPVRWPRIVATDDEDEEVGWAHGDDRGEFVLVVRAGGRLQVAPPPSLALTLTVHVPAEPPPVDPLDRAADLVREPVARDMAQPGPGTPEHDVLRGIALPAGYREATTVPVGLRPGEFLILPDIE